MLLEDLLQEFIFDCRLRKLSERTIKTYHNNLARFFEILDQELEIKKLAQLKAPVIKWYIHYMTERGNKETYINGVLKLIRTFFLYCEQEEYIIVNPMDKIRFQKEPIPLIETFNDAEVRRMIRYYDGKKFLDVRNKLIMILLLDTGIRNHEICKLKVEDIRDTYILINGKGKKQRAVPITPIVNKQLIKYNRIRDEYIEGKFHYDTDYLLLSQKGKKLTIETIERIVKSCGEACKVREGIRISPHTCRHYFAQAQLKNGCDLYTLSRLLGHSKVDITKVYLRSMNNDDFLDIAVGTSPLMNL